MINDPVDGTAYNSRDTQAVQSVLIELAQVLGAQSGNFVLVGGSVPGILFREITPQHIGTLDIDIELNPVALGDYGYVDMVTELEKRGYHRNVPGLKPFQMLRTIKVDDADPIGVVVDLLMPKTAQVKPRDVAIVEGLRVLRIDGGDVAINHAEKMCLEGMMPDGRHNTVEILVASIPALLVMKGYALGGRMKEKDAYDVWYSIKHYQEGMDALVQQCKAILDEPGVKEGYRFIAQKFSKRDTYGPETVRKFLMDRPDQLMEMDAEQIQTDAFMQVNQWCQRMGLDKQ